MGRKILVKAYWKLIGTAWLLMSLTFQNSCADGKLRNSGLTEFDLDGIAKVRLPNTLSRIWPKNSKLLGLAGSADFQVDGDTSSNPLDMNLWAVSHAFAFS